MHGCPGGPVVVKNCNFKIYIYLTYIYLYIIYILSIYIKINWITELSILVITDKKNKSCNQEVIWVETLSIG